MGCKRPHVINHSAGVQYLWRFHTLQRQRRGAVLVSYHKTECYPPMFINNLITHFEQREPVRKFKNH
jgi:hypothetical protein